ncbi:hypothetical protein ACFL29_01785 [Patescibacteria group bacterium]
MKKIKIFLYSVLGILFALPTYAQDYGLGKTQTAAQLPSGDLSTMIGKIIGGFLGLIGVFFFVLLIYGGYTWMSSFGNKEKVDRAKNIIVAAVIGMVIILAAYVITDFVVGAVTGSTAE